MKVQVVYDRSFAWKYNKNHTTIVRAINRILVHANSYFKLRSLTTKIELDTQDLPYEYIPLELDADIHGLE